MLLIRFLVWIELCSANIDFEMSQVLHMFSFESDRCTSGNRFGQNVQHSLQFKRE
jgi:hypothetical protein